MNLGDKLKSLRLNTKKTLKEQSDILGVSLNSVYRWEHNLAVPKKSMLAKIAEHYDIPINWLLQETGSEDHIEYANNSARPETNLEAQLLKMFRSLSENNKYKVLGYIERIYIENLDQVTQY